MFQQYKYIFMVVAAIIVVAVIAVVVLVIQAGKDTASVPPPTTIEDANFPGSAIKTADATGSKITWQTEQGPVEIANIFNMAVEKNQYGDPDTISLAEGNRYSIKYLYNGDFILVNLSTDDPNEARVEAEQKLVSVLQADKSKLCWLPVRVMVNFDPELQIFDYGLSFCSESAKTIQLE